LELVRLATTEELDVLDAFELVLLTATEDLDVLDSFEPVLLTIAEELDVVGNLELDVEDAEEEVELIVVQGSTLTVWLKSYISNRFAPPQNSDAFPLQSMLQPLIPSGASPPPFSKLVPQSTPS
jgi:hypothetical protein